MSEKINDGGPAFPVIPPEGRADGFPSPAEGMSLRDWFAGQALAGMWVGRESDFLRIESPAANDIARSAFKIADAMLAERTKGE